MAMKARAATPTRKRVFSARRPMRMSASMTITRTAALMPNSAPSTAGMPRPTAYNMLSASMTSAPGRTKRVPAASPPRVPCRSHPTYVASLVASGPGRSTEKLSACRKRLSSIHFFSSTSTRCMIAICPAGPPKLMKPSFSQKASAAENAIGGDALLFISGAGATLPHMSAIAEGLRRVLELDRELWHIVALSLEVSLSAVLIATALGLPLGALLAVKRFPGRRTLIVLLNALMGLPPVVVGLLIYLLLSRAGPLGPLGLLFTPGAMIIAQSVLVLPIIAALSRQALEDAWREYEEQLRSLGAREFTAALTLLWDARFSLVTAVLAGLGRAAAEGGAVMIVGGNIDGVTRVMTTAIALETSKGALPLALGLGIVLIAIVLALNTAAQLIKDAAQRRFG